MIIYPAIDILGGKAVRLYKGDYDNVTVYGTPLEAANKWLSSGSDFLHLVDLNGARGDVDNREKIAEIRSASDCFIQIGGGIRNLEQARKYLDLGVNQVIIGTAAVTDQVFLEELVKKYPDQVTVGVDARNGKVSIGGWLSDTELNADDFIKKLEEIGVKRVVYTDISKDGTLTGPNFSMYESVLASVDIEIIASGGISCLDDLKRLKKIGLDGVIVGKALYENKFTLEEALC
ncbi:1-(5-phosphoribosyl)-5-[(5-phosphoribosylamino)methylideneamino]imidazole-4-carboxamide isomerase [Acidaminobacter sp. JC074]|uniref:1-(5-phosphoribosyl)-5-[(5- phosphoribosylamino)methylideneamino]imidazole-4- carboxamide isomerase n=1 Tax=Acidaminobacter sp. JC074 TaxID=2530199 RepID=UPI001F0D772C|nr:1-(5-phosphoribosyl)-5-[(5-phosphoribosylamino)methylideneamino]imidazole-4-carboxamide isomerase [Acidaminobacter sp. JC074]MCH4888520.1 1-(5-phosphoribosyl)-5-[(5-phosphoribosylamino)methylideneamino]imidazole-4-carboxamide isomerase [Acidaminobacter sp. JC074]